MSANTQAERVIKKVQSLILTLSLQHEKKDQPWLTDWIKRNNYESGVLLFDSPKGIPLYQAASYNHEKIIYCLLLRKESHAQCHAHHSQNGLYPLDRALLKGNIHAIAVLAAHDAPYSEDALAGFYKQYPDDQVIHFEKWNSPDMADKTGRILDTARQEIEIIRKEVEQQEKADADPINVLGREVRGAFTSVANILYSARNMFFKLPRPQGSQSKTDANEHCAGSAEHTKNS